MHKRSSLFSWRPNTTVVLIVGFTAVLIAIVASYALENFKPTTQVFLGMGGVYNLRVANSEGERYKGLSGVKELEPNGGLIMVFENEGAHKIAMRDMHIPIDAVWLDKDKKVIHTQRSLSPVDTARQYGPVEPFAQYILELPEGAVKNGYIRKGDIALFDLQGVK